MKWPARYALLMLVLTGCTLRDPMVVQMQEPVGRTAVGAVAMPDTHSAEAALAVLAAGGNAVDAAVAAAFVLAVTYPEAGNIGGGGFMLIHAGAQDMFLDYRETAPAAARRDMYLDASGEVIPKASLVGELAAGTPGTVAGLWAAHRRFGSLPWAQLVAPAVELARAGFVASAHLTDRIAEEVSFFEGRTNFEEYFGAIEAGATWRQPELAATLERIAQHGREGFYTGATARLIAAQMQAGNGLVTADDLAAYRVAWREPLTVQWRDYRLVSAPPPSSGGFAVIQLLKMKDFLAAEFAGHAHNSPQYIHLVAELEKRVFADRAEYLGDPDFVDVRIDELIDNGYLRRRAAGVDPNAISTMDSVAPGLEERHTTHFSIVDASGNAVANTYTLNTWFGSGVVVAGAGFLLNNEMDDFSAKPGVPNYYGVVGESANAIAPGKRMLSSMSPTMLLRDGEVEMVLGTPGGSTIFTSVFQAIVNILDFHMTPQQAVAATRFHHQLLPPDLVTYSPGFPLPAHTVGALADRGYRAAPHAYEFGDLQVIWRNNKSWLTGSDPRGRGVGVGVGE